MLKASDGRIVVSIDMQKKQSHQFEDGTKIHLARGYNNFNLRDYYPVNAVVIAANDIPTGTEILLQYTAIQDTFLVHNYKPLSGSQIADDVKYYSIPQEMAYAYLEDGDWKPMKNIAFALRVFRPYAGALVGIEPTQIKDTLFITTGHLKGKIVKTLKASDYQLVFQDTNGREGNIVVVEHYEDGDNDRDLIICIMDELTEQVHAGKLTVGLTKTDAKSIHESWQKQSQ